MDIEKAMVASLTTSDIIQEVWDLGLKEEVFEDPVQKQRFRFILDYWLDNSMSLAPTEEVLNEEFGPQEEYEPEESVRWLVDKLKSRYVTNQTQSLMRRVAMDTVDDPQGSLGTLYSESWQIKENVTPRAARKNMATSVQERRIRYAEKSQNQEQGAPVGIEEVDEFTGGILPGELAVIAGYAKTGKSFFLVNAAVQARRQGYTPYIASLEQSVEEFEDRIDAFASGVGYGKLQRGELTPNEIDRLNASQDQFASLGPVYLESPPRGERTVVSIVNRARQLGANYLIVDQLSWLDARERHRERRDEYKELIYDLKEEIGRATAGMLPCLMAVQFNRASGPKGRGEMNNIANAADIEQTVDIAYGLYRTNEIRAADSMVLDIMGSRRTDNDHFLLGWHLDRESSIFYRRRYEEEPR
jgi:hypothetical protein